MSRILRHRPSPAMVVACLALAVALTGTSYAAIRLPANSVGAKQLKKNAVTSPKIKNNQVMGADVNEATLGTVPSATSATNATNAANAANASNLGGAPASAYTKATDFAYGEMDANGGVKASPPHKNIVSVTRPLTGVYCINLSFTPTFAEGSATGATAVGLNVVPDIPATSCPAGTEATVYVISDGGALTNDDFQVLFGSF